MNKSSFSEDILLWEQVLNSNRNSFSKLFRKYYTPLLNYGLKLVAEEELVKDSIQELFFKLWEQRSNLSNVEYVRSYLYVSLRRAVLHQAEIKKDRNRRDQSYSRESLGKRVTHEQLMILEELKQERQQALEVAIEALSHRQKEAVFLKFYSGFSNAEIAQIMEVNKQSVYNYIHRAIEALKIYLDHTILP